MIISVSANMLIQFRQLTQPIGPRFGQMASESDRQPV